ncbi:MAG: hypothetical protein JRF48_00615 [Deltaproteobacteria bacterium]|nr:hypothetical protein [Deltaproteobacteria bacterium]
MALSECSIASQEAGESLAGTAVESVDRWLLLEVTAPWAPKALQSEVLPQSVRAQLTQWLQTPRSRLQFIRRPGRPGKRSLFMVVSTASDRRQASQVELDRYEDLLDVDIDALPTKPAAPTCLVCVHGRRDRCCGLHGSSVFRAIQSHGVDVWQTSHLGGHRFAACALWLPDGLMYGRLRTEHVEDFVTARRAVPRRPRRSLCEGESVNRRREPSSGRRPSSSPSRPGRHGFKLRPATRWFGFGSKTPTPHAHQAAAQPQSP